MNPQHLLDSAYRQVLAGQVIPALRLLGKPLSDLYIQNEQEDRSKELRSHATVTTDPHGNVAYAVYEHSAV